MMSEREKVARISTYMGTITTDLGKAVLNRLLHDVCGPLAGAKKRDLTAIGEGLDENQLRMLLQLTENTLLDNQYSDLLIVMRRYKLGDEKERSQWRRVCQRLKVSTAPVGFSKNKRDYNQRRHALRRGVGKPTYALREIREVVKSAMCVREKLPEYVVRTMEEIGKLAEAGLSRSEE